MIITIARECGSGGHAIGELIAKHYGIRCYDRHILVTEAKKQGVYDELEPFFSEKPMDSLLYSIAMNSSKNPHQATFDRFKKLIPEKDFVLIGRCGNVLYREKSDAVSVFIHADMEAKINRTVRKQNVDRIKARQLVDYVNDKRKSFHHNYTREDWGIAKNYDFCLNSSLFGDEGTAQAIIGLVERKKLLEKQE